MAVSVAVPVEAAGDRVEVGVVGAGAMGSGIAQVAAVAGHPVRLLDTREGAAKAAIERIGTTLQALVAKGRMAQKQATATKGLLRSIDSHAEFAGCGLVIEAIVEEIEAKRDLFRSLEYEVSKSTLLATNTSSFSVTAIGSGLRFPERFAGMHFFNPAPMMPLVEIIAGAGTAPETTQMLHKIAHSWGKKPVYARSTPGFIVNRVARPFYGEALRVLSESAADCATIDAVMREAGGFRMGPFELMDLIGNDINYAVTRSVFDAFYGDARYTPSLLQLELVQAGYLGKKTGRGFYEYVAGVPKGTDAKTCPAFATPARVAIYGDDSLSRCLVERLDHSTVTVERASSHRDGRLVRNEAFVLYRTDGRTATQRSLDNSCHNLVLVDLMLNCAQAGRAALTAAEQAGPEALASAAGLLQAAGFTVSPIDDTPGMIVMRTVAMLANEAADAVHHRVCSAADCDLAMRAGVNYPCGPLEWADAVGAARIARVLDHLAESYGSERYRVSPLLRRNAVSAKRFYRPGEAKV